MNKHQKRERARAKRLRQEARHGGLTVQGATPLDVLRHFLPEAPPRELEKRGRLAQSDALSDLRREPERRRPWWRWLWTALWTSLWPPLWANPEDDYRD